jgi:F-type H+-transporting ATPase subunit epsilon
VTILAETAERPEDVDQTRAQAARERAERQLAGRGGAEEIDYAEVASALERAQVRLRVATRRAG